MKKPFPPNRSKKKRRKKRGIFFRAVQKKRVDFLNSLHVIHCCSSLLFCALLLNPNTPLIFFLQPLQTSPPIYE